LKLISRGKPTIGNNVRYTQNSSMMNNNSMNSMMMYSSHNDINHIVETRIEDGKLLYERRWFHRGQAVFVEGTEVSKFSANISAIVGTDVIMVKRASDNSKFRIYLHQLSSGKISIKRRAN
jgi:Sin3 histone deacetylase corepressor complex component SDS3